MKYNYVENFIDSAYHVDLDFNNLISHTECEERPTSIPRMILAILAILFSLICIVEFWWITLVFSLLLTFFSLPRTSNRIQDTMGVIFPNKFFWSVSLVIMICMAISTGFDYENSRQKKAAQELALQEKKVQEEIYLKKQIEAREEAERQRKHLQSVKLNELIEHQNKADDFIRKHKYNDAIKELVSVSSLANASGRPYLKIDSDYAIATLYFNQKKWDKALRYYNEIPNTSMSHGDTLHYNKATCFVRLGDVETAVNTLRSGPRTKRTEGLFEKINPVEKQFWRRNYKKQPLYNYNRKYGEW